MFTFTRGRWVRSLIVIVGMVSVMMATAPSVVETSPRSDVTAIGPRSDCEDVVCT